MPLGANEVKNVHTTFLIAFFLHCALLNVCQPQRSHSCIICFLSEGTQNSVHNLCAECFVLKDSQQSHSCIVCFQREGFKAAHTIRALSASAAKIQTHPQNQDKCS